MATTFNIATAASGVLRDAHYEVTGLNRVTSSDLFTTSPWSSTGGTPTDAGSAPSGYPANGWTLASGVTTKQVVAFGVTGTKTVSVVVKGDTAPTSTVAIYKTNGSPGNVIAVTVTWTAGVPTLSALAGSPTLYDVQPLGSGWYRIAFSGSVTYTDTNELRLTSNSGNSSFAAPQVEDRAGATAYMQAASGDKGFRFERTTFLEAARTNVFTYSAQFDNAAWGKTRSSITADQEVAPDGTTSADKWIEDGSASTSHYISRGSLGAMTDNTSQAFSVYAKAGTRSWIYLSSLDKAGVQKDTYFNIAVGYVGTIASGHTARIEVLPNGWFRCSIVWSAASGGTGPTVYLALATADNTPTYSGDGASYVYLWGAQLEIDKAFVSSYIPTTTAAVTRNADVLSFPFTTSPRATTVYLRFIERGALLHGTNGRTFSIGDPGSNGTFYVLPSAAGGAYKVNHKNGGTTVDATAAASAAIGDVVELRAVLNANGSVYLGQSINGGAEAVTATSAVNALAAAWNALFFYLNGESGAAGFGAYSHVRVENGVRTLTQMRALAGVAA